MSSGAIEIQAAVCREFGGPLTIETLSCSPTEPVPARDRHPWLTAERPRKDQGDEGRVRGADRHRRSPGRGHADGAAGDHRPARSDRRGGRGRGGGRRHGPARRETPGAAQPRLVLRADHRRLPAAVDAHRRHGAVRAGAERAAVQGRGGGRRPRQRHPARPCRRHLHPRQRPLAAGRQRRSRRHRVGEHLSSGVAHRRVRRLQGLRLRARERASRPSTTTRGPRRSG